jgi:hypothetical protein
MSDLPKKELPPNARIEVSTVEHPSVLEYGKTYARYFVDAPFLPEQVRSMNAYQASGHGHPFTCGRDRSDVAHRAHQREHGGDLGQLLATEGGWVCPVPGCGYVQSWAWLFMADWSWGGSDEPSRSEADNIVPAR